MAKFQGITAAGFRDKGSASAYTPIPNLVQENSKQSRPLAEGPKNPTGGQYYGGENPTIEIVHLSKAQHNALAAKWTNDQEVEVEYTLTDGSTETITGLPEVNRLEIKGQATGRVAYMLKVVSFATSPAV